MTMIWRATGGWATPSAPSSANAASGCASSWARRLLATCGVATDHCAKMASRRATFRSLAFCSLASGSLGPGSLAPGSLTPCSLTPRSLTPCFLALRQLLHMPSWHTLSI